MSRHSGFSPLGPTTTEYIILRSAYLHPLIFTRRVQKLGYPFHYPQPRCCGQSMRSRSLQHNDCRCSFNSHLTTCLYHSASTTGKIRNALETKIVITMSQNQSTSPSGLTAMSCVLPVLSIGAVGLRFWLRGRQKVHLEFDDWLMLPALVSPYSSRIQSRGSTRDHWQKADTLVSCSFCLLVCAYALS